MTVIPKSTFKKFRKKRPVEAEVETTIEELDDLLDKMARIKARGVQDRDMYLGYEAAAMAIMRERKLESYKGRKVVEPSVAELDIEKFKQRIMPKQWEQITRRVLDKDLLKAAVERGIIDPQVVRQCTSYVDRKSYIYGN